MFLLVARDASVPSVGYSHTPAARSLPDRPRLVGDILRDLKVFSLIVTQVFVPKD